MRPFVYRRYLDYGVFESLREMKALIEREVERRELADDVKLGPGGIREIEFIVQALQLIRGGRDRRLQTPSLLAALPRLGETRLLPPQAVATSSPRPTYSCAGSRTACRCSPTRRCTPAGRCARARAHRARHGRRRLAGARWRELEAQRARVSHHFRLVVFAGGAAPDPRAVRIDLGRFWDSEAETAALDEALAARRLQPTAPKLRACCSSCAARALVRRLDEPGRKRLQALLPALLADVAPGAARSCRCCGGCSRSSRPSAQRSAYFALLQENAAARARLVELCRHGEFLAGQIAAYPLLLDELIDERLLTQLPTRAELAPRARRAHASSCARTTRSGRSRRCASSSARRCSGSPWPTSPARCRSCR